MTGPSTLTPRIAVLLTAVLAVSGTVASADEHPRTPGDTTTTTTTVPDSTTTTTDPAGSDTTTTTTVPESTTTTTTTTSTTTTTTTTTIAPTPSTAVPGGSTRCAPPTTTTTTTTTTVPESTTTTTTTTTTIPGSTTTTTVLPAKTLPPCPTTTPPTTAPPTTVPSNEPAPAPLGLDIPAELDAILLTIRLVESSERYEIGPNKGNASGAYQYIASTWNNYRGYPHAYLAPPFIQDERAVLDVQSILERWKGDVSMVPVIWYYPRAAREPALMDEVPLPGAGNRLTVREYQHRWLDTLAFVTGESASYRTAAVPPELRFLAGRPPELIASNDELDEIAFPVLGGSVVLPQPACTAERCEPGSQAIVFGQKLQPIVAVASGVVTAVDEGDPLSGDVTVTIADALGRTYVYAGFNDDSPGTDDGEGDPSLRLTALAQVGRTVRAGQIIGFMGDTDPMPNEEHRGAGDEPIWPHLRLTIRDGDGVRLDADLLVAQAQDRQACHVGIGPWSVPADERIDRSERDDVEVSALRNGSWTLHDDGTVTAIGRSALILPPEDCVWAPAEPYGPDAAGEDADEGWDDPIEIAPEHWVTGVQAGSTRQAFSVRP